MKIVAALFTLNMALISQTISASDTVESRAGDSYANGEARLSELLETTVGQTKIYGESFADDCALDERLVDAPISGTFSQYIYNGTYEWEILAHDGRTCIYLIEPIRRMLTKLEASRFDAASDKEYPIDQPKQPASEEIVPSKSIKKNPADTIEFDKDGNLVAGASQAPVYASKASTPLGTFQFPYNSIALVQSGPENASGTGSAVQISPYVFVTVAHNFVNRDTGAEYGNVRLFPRYRAPNVVPGVRPVHSVYNTLYTSSPLLNTAYAHDVGFMKIPTAMPIAKYPIIFSAQNNEFPPVTVGLFGSDVYWSNSELQNGCVPSLRSEIWYVPGTYPACGVPSTTYIFVRSLGYPINPGGVPNPTHIPYTSTAAIRGYPMGSSNFGLFHPPVSGPAIPGFEGQISGGMSGGPTFAVLQTSFGYSYPISEKAYVIGVNNAGVTSIPTPYFVATGRGSINSSFWSQHATWTPNFSLTSNKPNPTYVDIEGGSVKLTIGAPGVSYVDLYRAVSGLNSEAETYVGSFLHGEISSQSVQPNHNYTFKLKSYDTALATLTFTVYANGGGGTLRPGPEG